MIINQEMLTVDQGLWKIWNMRLKKVSDLQGSKKPVLRRMYFLYYPLKNMHFFLFGFAKGGK